MTVEIALVFAILGAALILFITEIVRMDLVALLVLAALALAGLVSPAEALAGFSNPAVITVWAMFVLSAGLTNAGVAEILGGRLLTWVGRGETRLISTIMLTAGILSAFMNNIGVATLMLPVVIHVARRTGTPPSRLLMPVAYGSLLGGLTTLIGTPPNLLVSQALRAEGLDHFAMFDFVPVGGAVMVAGTAFVALFGRRLLPRRDPAGEVSPVGIQDLPQQYRLDERSAVVRLPAGSPLSGRTLAESRIGWATGLNVYTILRGDAVDSSPAPDTVLLAGDRLVVGGKLDRFNELRSWKDLILAADDFALDYLVTATIGLAELRVAPGASIAGRTLGEIDFRKRFRVFVLAMRRDSVVVHQALVSSRLEAGDRLLVQGARGDLAALRDAEEFRGSLPADESALIETYHLRERIFTVRLPSGSQLAGRGLAESRIGDALGLGVVGLKRGNVTRLIPPPEEVLEPEDVLIVRGQKEDLTVFNDLQSLEIEAETIPGFGLEAAGLMEAMLAPRTTLAGKSAGELRFRERYGLRILAILREGRAWRSNLRDMKLRFGDALLLQGPVDRQQLLTDDANFLVLTKRAVSAPDKNRAPAAVLIMAGVVIPVLLGWLPISISAVAGVCAMVLARCITMDEAYRAIEWRAVFLIAGMLPLGAALERTGAASYVAEGLLAAVGVFGTWGVLLSLYLVTALATAIIPTAALVVLMAPIAFRACAAVGLSPHAALMAVAMAASASFTSPVSHPANVLVMGPGGYRFVDYVKVGVPLTVVVFLVVLIVLPIFWPLAA